MNNEAIVNSIKNLCKDNNITVGQLEKEVGLSQGLVSKWKDKTPSLDKIVDIADYFHVSLDEVVGRNQNSHNCENNLINALIAMTTDNEIQWSYIDDFKSENINDKSFEEVFNIYDEEVEIYKCKYNNSYIFLVVQYCLNEGLMKDIYIQLYLQPDKNSNPIYQDIDIELAEEFWLEVRKPFKGIPDELKANIIKQQIISHNEQIMINSAKQYIENASTTDKKLDELLVDENAKKIFAKVSSPEIQQLISMFTNPKMTYAINSAQKLIHYFKDIEEEKNKNNK